MTKERSRTQSFKLSSILLPSSPLPSLLHSRIPTPPSSALSHPSTATPQHSVIEKPHINSNEDWWKWPAPTSADVRSRRRVGEMRENQGIPGKRVEGKVVGTYRVGEIIGEGTSGRVRLARHTVTGTYAAVKMIKKLSPSHKHFASVDREIIVSKLVEHDYLLKLYDVYETPSHIFLVSEYCELGELYKLVMSGQMSPETTRRFFYQIVAAVSHLHRMSICHRDIKLENLLVVEDSITGELSIKLADLGMAAHADGLMETSCGSPHYAAPEIIRGDPYDGCASDIWSMGIVLFALISSQLPFFDENVPTVLGYIKRGRYKMHSSIQGDARDLIARILIVDVSRRIKLEDIRTHAYLTNGSDSYVPPDPTMPYPLVGADFEPIINRDKIDKVILSNLKVLCKGESEETIMNAISSSEMTKARVFYIVLDNFRSRTYVSEADKLLRQSLAPPITPTTKVSTKKPRRAVSVPALSLSTPISSQKKQKSPMVIYDDSTDEAVWKDAELPVIEVEHASPDSTSFDDLSSPFVNSRLRRYSSEITTHSFPMPPLSPGLRFVNDENSTARGRPALKLKGFSRKLKGLFIKGSEDVIREGIEDEEARASASSSYKRTSFLKRSVGYNSLHRVNIPLSPLPSPTFPTSPTPPGSPHSISSIPATRVPFSKLDLNDQLYHQRSSLPVLVNISSSPKTLFVPTSPISIPVRTMNHCDSPPSPTPVKRRPSPLTLDRTTRRHQDLPSSSFDSNHDSLPLLSALTEDTILTPADSLFVWSPVVGRGPRDDHSVSSHHCHSPRQQQYDLQRIDELENQLREREEEMKELRAKNEVLSREIVQKDRAIVRLTEADDESLL